MRNIVANSISRNVLQGPRLGYFPGFLANDDDEFALIVYAFGLLCDEREWNRIKRAVERGKRSEKQDRVFGDRCPSFTSMLLIIQAQATNGPNIFTGKRAEKRLDVLDIIFLITIQFHQDIGTLTST